jgi:hypothetical protein
MITQAISDEIEAFYVREFIWLSNERMLSTMSDYGRLLMGVFDGYAFDKYPEIEPYAHDLIKKIKSININDWLEQHPEFKAEYPELLDEWYR